MPKDLVLIVEDNPAQQIVLAALAKRAGVDTKVLDNGQEAIAELFENKNYSLVLMDWKIHEVDGVECTRQIRSFETVTGEHVPIVAVTAFEREEIAEDFIAAGANEFLTKPFSVNQFNMIIKRYCQT